MLNKETDQDLIKIYESSNNLKEFVLNIKKNIINYKLKSCI